MGLIWDLIQQGQIGESQRRASSLEERVQMLEAQLSRTNETLVKLLHALERRFGEDLDGDHRIG